MDSASPLEQEMQRDRYSSRHIHSDTLSAAVHSGILSSATMADPFLPLFLGFPLEAALPWGSRRDS